MRGLRQTLPVGLTFGWELDWSDAVRMATRCARDARHRYCVYRLAGPGVAWGYGPVPR
jgi:hypothetical protein